MKDISGKIYTFKMVSGEEIVAKVHKGSILSDGKLSCVVELDRPMVTQPVRTDRGIDFQMYPMVFSVEGVLSVYSSSIMGSNPTDAGFEKAYLQRVSGLELPQTLIG